MSDESVAAKLSEGGPYLVDVPIPTVTAGKVVIRNECSLVSIGTELMLIDFGEATLVGEAIKQLSVLRMCCARCK